MCEERADLRMTLTQVMRSSSLYASSHMREPFTAHVMKMYELVFGSTDNVISPLFRSQLSLYRQASRYVCGV